MGRQWTLGLGKFNGADWESGPASPDVTVLVPGYMQPAVRKGPRPGSSQDTTRDQRQLAHWRSESQRLRAGVSAASDAGVQAKSAGAMSASTVPPALSSCY